eukprot:scaffold3365_cov358-Prasinococcus_capsulatus_cf.AAC.2
MLLSIQTVSFAKAHIRADRGSELLSSSNHRLKVEVTSWLMSLHPSSPQFSGRSSVHGTKLLAVLHDVTVLHDDADLGRKALERTPFARRSVHGGCHGKGVTFAMQDTIRKHVMSRPGARLW